MTAPAFGFSVGDFIAGIQIAKRAVEALSDTNGAPHDYALAITWLQATERNLRHVQALQETSATSELVQQVLTLAHACTIPVSKILKKIEPYEQYLKLDAVRKSQQGVAFTIRQATAKVRWALSTTKSLQKLNTKIAPSLNQIMILLQLIAGIKVDQKNRNLEVGISNLQDAFQQATLNISQRKDQFSGEIIHIYIAKYSSLELCEHTLMAVPFEYFRYWSICESYLFHEIGHVSLLEKMHAGDGVFFYFGTSVVGESLRQTWQPRQVRWDTWAKPGSRLEMQIVENEYVLMHFLSWTQPDDEDALRGPLLTTGSGVAEFCSFTLRATRQRDQVGQDPGGQRAKIIRNFMKTLKRRIAPYSALVEIWGKLLESIILSFRPSSRRQGATT